MRVLVNGVAGQMGRSVVDLAGSMPEVEIVAGVDIHPPADLPFPVFSKISDCNLPVDVVIDFSRPDALEEMLSFAARSHAAAVVGTTGMTQEHFKLVETFSQQIPILQAANLSLGLNLMLQLVEKAAGFLGNDFDVEIIEKHHNRKVDAPSGTALVIADTINRAQGNGKRYVYGRHTKDERRTKREIGIHAIRGGTIVGEHEAMFIGQDENLSINYTTASRKIYALGAIRAAQFVVGRPPRRYSMSDLMLEASAVTTVMMDTRQAMVTVRRVPAEPVLVAGLFTELAFNNINVDMISQTAPTEGTVDISFTLHETDLPRVTPVLETCRKTRPDMTMALVQDIAKLSIEGQGMEHQTGVAAKVFQALANQNIPIHIITTSETKIACVVDREQARQSVTAVSSAFGL